MAGSWRSGGVGVPIAALLLILLCPPASVADESKDTTILLRSAAPVETIEIEEGLRPTLVARDLERDDSEWREPIARLPTSLERSLPEGSRWHFSIEGDHYFMREAELEIVPGEPLELEIWPAGWIRARTEMADPKAEIPTEVEVRFQKGVDAHGLAEFQAVHCPLEKSRLHCKLPAGRLDLRFAVPGQIPVYAWDRSLAIGETTDLDLIRFRPGASVIGWVASERGPLGEEELAEVEIALGPGVISRSAVEKPLEREAAMTRRATPGPRGFFQVSGLDPGLYRIEADHPLYSAARQGPFRIDARSEIELELLELPQATFLEVEASLPTDPYSKPWNMSLSQRGTDQVVWETLASGETDVEGVWRVNDLAPGEYSLGITGSNNSQWYSERIDILPGSNAVEADVDFTRLEGLVTLGGEPVPGSQALFYDPKSGRQVNVRGNAEGRFYTFLPVDVVWQVDIEQPGMQIYSRVPELEIPPRKGEDRWPKVEIELPNTRLEGRVIDEVGQPVAGINVDLNSAEGSTYRSTDEEGRFVFRGLRPADWTVQALGDEPPRQSQVEAMTLTEADEKEVPDLVVETNHRITGHLVGAEGEPISAARIVAKPRFRPGQSVQTSDTIEFTDLEGVFELSVPGRVDEYWLTFSPPGYAISHQLVRLPLEQPLIVLAEGEAGTLVVRYVDPPELFEEAKIGSFGGFYVYLKISTQILGQGPIGDFFGLEDWRRQHGVTEQDHEFQRTYPRLAPGPYTACFGNGLLHTWAQGMPLPAEIEDRHCDSGFLSAGGELVLTIPPSAYEAEAARLRAQESATSESR